MKYNEKFNTVGDTDVMTVMAVAAGVVIQKAVAVVTFG